jgi:hypothetical protein
MADKYRDAFWSSPPPYEPEVGYPIPENKTHSSMNWEVAEGVEDLQVLGDITGGPSGYPDYRVDMRDIGFIARHFGGVHPDPEYDFDCDIIYDTVVDMRDIATAARNFGSDLDPPPGMVEPVREKFFLGMVMDQMVMHGFYVNFTDSSVVPWGTNNETRISLNGYSPQLAEILAPGNNSWRIYVGPRDENATDTLAEFMFTKIYYLQLMLRSHPGEQEYLSNWTTRINLPPAAELLNLNELIGLSWTIDYGGGTSMETIVTVDMPTITVFDRLTVTEQAINATNEYLNDTYTEFKRFSIDFSLPGSLSQASMQRKSYVCGSWTPDPLEWSRTYSLRLAVGAKFGRWKFLGFSAKMRVTASITTAGYFGMKFGTFEILGIKIPTSIKSLEAWMSITGSVTVTAEASVYSRLSKSWYSKWIHLWYPFCFYIGPVPVEVTAYCNLAGGFDIGACFGANATYSVTMTASLKAGAKWTAGSGWNDIWEPGSEYSMTGPSISASAQLTLTPFLELRFGLLIYHTAGPFISFSIEVPMSLHWDGYLRIDPFGDVTYCYWTTWDIEVWLRVRAGVCVADWLKKIIEIIDEIFGTSIPTSYDLPIWDYRVKRWEGRGPGSCPSPLS